MARQNDDIPEALEATGVMMFRASGLGIYGALMRFAGMPLEKIAIYMNSTQVSGSNAQQLRQAVHLTFRDETRASGRSLLAPYRVVGPASMTAWFLQYSVMGFVFQLCDSMLSSALGTPRMPYGAELMEDPRGDKVDINLAADVAKRNVKAVLAPAFAGIIESMVANRAEAQRYFGIQRFASIERTLGHNSLKRMCGPAFLANSSRNFIMSSTSFVITPILYRNYFPQEHKSASSVFWFGLGANIFLGNSIAITQQALWGRALDYSAIAKTSAPESIAVRSINYSAVVREGLALEGPSAFFTVPKWASRVLMNAPVQGTLPWFYNEILPMAEPAFLHFLRSTYVAAGGEVAREVAVVKTLVHSHQEDVDSVAAASSSSYVEKQ